MKINTEDLPGYQSFKTEKRTITEISQTTGKINIRAIINIDIKTGKINISDEKGRIKFNFTNPKLAKRWADAIR